uniref:Uncharacterized protein n=1 Tax=Cucumis melo TaxID=3656 RepID=A0A9I9E6Y5_CUCME
MSLEDSRSILVVVQASIGASNVSFLLAIRVDFRSFFRPARLISITIKVLNHGHCQPSALIVHRRINGKSRDGRGINGSTVDGSTWMGRDDCVLVGFTVDDLTLTMVSSCILVIGLIMAIMLIIAVMSIMS